MWYYLIAIGIIALDQLTKWIIVKSMALGEQIPVIEPFLYITSHRNTGAAWGILQGQMWFFYIITVIVIGAVIYYIQQYAKTNALIGVALGFILGGAIGNFIDRIFRKEVVDFVDTYIGNYDFPIFNVADSALVVGVGLVFIATILDERKKGSKQT
ncbi:signal peptidase II [Pontibacillus yanchengensis]|uniref:Lipoprotein signal peptidase n=1 Tax=Pontibacillus yanchengensis Y32 TaxID=1385514 RepID=A0A0A2TQ33_9BACI|nr:signal peptidase II [Pontibacillus yanchengensis]KGP71395.1 peptidase A8 [Pontibacillus yanchengensis Y32]